MKFEQVPIDESHGLILAHNVNDGSGRRRLRKGRVLDQGSIEILRDAGKQAVYVARLEPDDVPEDECAEMVARRAAGSGLERKKPSTGRVNLRAAVRGVVRVAVDRLRRLNGVTGVTLATLRDGSVVAPGKMVATVKILPYALPASALDAALAEIGDGDPIVHCVPLRSRRVSLIVTATEGHGKEVSRSFERALRERLRLLGSELRAEDVILVPLDESAERSLARTIEERAASSDLVILAGETAIQDRLDLAPAAVEEAGGRVVCYGAPVDPGNLLLLAELGGVPILGAPGCARSPKANIVDLVLPKMLLGEVPTREEVDELGHGGLLEDVPERPLPRSQLG